MDSLLWALEFLSAGSHYSYSAPQNPESPQNVESIAIDLKVDRTLVAVSSATFVLDPHLFWLVKVRR